MLFSAWHALAPSLAWRVPTHLPRAASAPFKFSGLHQGKHFLSCTLRAPWTFSGIALHMRVPGMLALSSIPKRVQNSLLYGCPPNINVFMGAHAIQTKPSGSEGHREGVTSLSAWAPQLSFRLPPPGPPPPGPPPKKFLFAAQVGVTEPKILGPRPPLFPPGFLHVLFSKLR